MTLAHSTLRIVTREVETPAGAWYIFTVLQAASAQRAASQVRPPK